MVFLLFFSSKDTIKGEIDIRLRFILEEHLHLKAAMPATGHVITLRS